MGVGGAKYLRTGRVGRVYRAAVVGSGTVGRSTVGFAFAVAVGGYRAGKVARCLHRRVGGGVAAGGRFG